MKITDRCRTTVKTFEELKPGDVFRDEDDRDIMMKIKSCHDEEINCVSLLNGEGYMYCDGGLKVTLISRVELIIG